MLIDCATCVARDIACEDCVVTVLLSRPPAPEVALDDTERSALARLADVGLVPPLRLVQPVTSRSPHTPLDGELSDSA